MALRNHPLPNQSSAEQVPQDTLAFTDTPERGVKRKSPGPCVHNCQEATKYRVPTSLLHLDLPCDVSNFFEARQSLGQSK